MKEEYNNLTGSEWASLGTTTLGLGLGYAGKEKDLQSAREQADALRAKGMSDVEVAKIMLEAERVKAEALKSGAGAGTQAGSKTLYIGLGIGAVVILGVVIYAVTRKKA